MRSLILGHVAARPLVTSILLVLLLVLGLGVTRAQGGEVLVLEIEGPVTPAMASYFDRGIETAEQQNAAAVLIILNTPGGAVDTTLDIVRLFRAASVPVVVYISPRGAQAASAGSIITAAAHAAGMAPETVIGAASPINADGSDINETAYRKAVEDLKATMRGLTERRGEEAVTLAEAMIEDARAVNAREALEAGLIDAVADSPADLLQQLDGVTVDVNEQSLTLQVASASLRQFPLNAIETVLHAVANPILIGILFAIGVQAILIEISNPGGWVAGFIGVLFLVLAFYGAGQLPVNWLGLGLIILAFVLFLAEVMTTTHGALAITGVVTLFAGLLVLFNSPGTPEFARISIPGAIAITVFTAGFFVFLVTMALRAQRRQAVTGIEGMVGQNGQVRRAFTSPTHKAPYRGMILVKGELWQAEADEELEEGERVVIVAVNGFTLQVERAEKGDREHENREPTAAVEGV